VKKEIEGETNVKDTIRFEGYAYQDGDVKLFPLVALNPDGSINKFETCLLLQESIRNFGTLSATIPSDRIANVLSQITGAAQSHGLSL
jgi:hypothetical protein